MLHSPHALRHIRSNVTHKLVSTSIEEQNRKYEYKYTNNKTKQLCNSFTCYLKIISPKM